MSNGMRCPNTISKIPLPCHARQISGYPTRMYTGMPSQPSQSLTTSQTLNMAPVADKQTQTSFTFDEELILGVGSWIQDGSIERPANISDDDLFGEDTPSESQSSSWIQDESIERPANISDDDLFNEDTPSESQSSRTATPDVEFLNENKASEFTTDVLDSVGDCVMAEATAEARRLDEIDHAIDLLERTLGPEAMRRFHHRTVQEITGLIKACIYEETKRPVKENEPRESYDPEKIETLIAAASDVKDRLTKINADKQENISNIHSNPCQDVERPFKKARWESTPEPHRRMIGGVAMQRQQVRFAPCLQRFSPNFSREEVKKAEERYQLDLEALSERRLSVEFHFLGPIITPRSSVIAKEQSSAGEMMEWREENFSHALIYFGGDTSIHQVKERYIASQRRGSQLEALVADRPPLYEELEVLTPDSTHVGEQGSSEESGDRASFEHIEAMDICQ